jgi:SAM-dependent methyltransferase
MINTVHDVCQFQICAVCGERHMFARRESRSIREGYPCPACRATLRYRDQALCIVDQFGNGRCASLTQLAASGHMDDLSVYEAALGGPFVKILSRLPYYVRSFYWEDVPLGEARNGVLCQDFRTLTFADESFDLIISSDVMEHVFEPLRAFAEIRRVLRVGGVHIFSIPTDWPMPEKTVERARLTQGRIEHLLEPRYHRGGDGNPSLVVTDWGADLLDRLRDLGMNATAVRRSAPLDPAYRNATFVTLRMS